MSDTQIDNLTQLVPPPGDTGRFIQEVDGPAKVSTGRQKLRVFVWAVLAIWILCVVPLLDGLSPPAPAAVTGDAYAQEEISQLGKLHANLQTTHSIMQELLSMYHEGPSTEQSEAIKQNIQKLAFMADQSGGIALAYHKSGRASKQPVRALDEIPEAIFLINNNVIKFVLIAFKAHLRPEGEPHSATRQEYLERAYIQMEEAFSEASEMMQRVQKVIANRIGDRGVGN
ncbi:hypothetical protein ACFOY8_12970 [Thalassospira xianhensis]|uniref:Uncharacterized protein n=1 Tax=Thalassospira xianhensis MCCC 1A02616 TaxID=1177929 RepID=A0A367UHS8_9PROT|nr:hypothetical protein [Thalassospira xianhensis]RCK07867.1 hypothetical protein TH5_02320 [Thalassospira xianhensis MCCC 1A02616]